MSALTIGSTAIRTVENLYSLNDLHVASGSSANHAPAQFMRNDQTKALIGEITRCADLHIIPTKVVRGKGKNQGTYACKELVYAYAMWISAAFMLQVIRAYDAIKTGGYTVRPHQSLSADEADMLRRVLTQHAESLPKDAQAAFIIKGWAKLKSHFGCSYRDIPSDKFTEALSLLGRHTLEHRPEPAHLGLPKEWIEVCMEAQTMPAPARRGLLMYVAGYCNAVKDGVG